MERFDETTLRTNSDHRQEQRGVRVTDEVAWLEAARDVLVHYLGIEWCQRTFLDPSNKADFSFKPMPSKDPVDGARYCDYVVNLAEMLLNFQPIQGFDEWHIRLKKRTDVQAAVAELEAAALLFKSAITFRFVPEVKKKGLDYDLEAIIGGNTVPCETKCKMPRTSVSDKTVKKALEKANRQIPRDQPNIVFMRIPETWISDPTSRVAFEGGLKRAFRWFERISAVVAYYRVWEMAGDGCICTYASYTGHNKTAKHSLAEFRGIIRPIGKIQYRIHGGFVTEIGDEVWHSIPDLVGRPKKPILWMTLAMMMVIPSLLLSSD